MPTVVAADVAVCERQVSAMIGNVDLSNSPI
jgi:hypothetical protein